MKTPAEGIVSVVAERAFNGAVGARPSAKGANGRARARTDADNDTTPHLLAELAELRRFKAAHQALVELHEADRRELENTRRL